MKKLLLLCILMFLITYAMSAFAGFEQFEKELPPPALGSENSPSSSSVEPNTQAPPQANNKIATSDLIKSSKIFPFIQATLGGDVQGTLNLKSTYSAKSFVPIDSLKAKNFNKVGLEFFKKNDLIESLKNFQLANEYDRTNPECSENLGFLLYLTGKFDDAEVKLIESLEVNPARASTWFTLGKVYSLKNYSELSYSCVVNACIFTRNINTTLNFIDKSESDNSLQNEVASKSRAACEVIKSRLNTNDVSLTSSNPKYGPAIHQEPEFVDTTLRAIQSSENLNHYNNPSDQEAKKNLWSQQVVEMVKRNIPFDNGFSRNEKCVLILEVDADGKILSIKPSTQSNPVVNVRFVVLMIKAIRDTGDLPPPPNGPIKLSINFNNLN